MTHRIYPALLLLLLAGVAWRPIASSDEPKRIDLEKKKIEGPLKKALSLPAAESAAAPAERKAVVDGGKRRIELPVKRALAAKAPDAERRLESKITVENPTKDVVAKSSSGFENPKVEPGKVRWHKDFQAACAAAKKSGRPVLLFQMMGKLDDRFC